MTDIATLQEWKRKVRTQMIAQQSPGVVGVGIDPTRLQLIVFSIASGLARDFVVRLLGGDALRDIRLVSGRVLRIKAFLPSEVKGYSELLLRATISVASLQLFPASGIQPGNGGDSGCLGCFVKLANGTVAALTVRHLFHDASAGRDVYFFDDRGSFLCGTSVALGSLTPGVVNDSDCALFSLLQFVVPENSGSLSGNHVRNGDLKKTEGFSVKNVASSVVLRCWIQAL